MSYNGSKYHGWQVQPNAVTVQFILNKALSMILKSTINCMGAGRTDTGVHAAKMVAHFESKLIFDIEQVVFKINAFLPKDIVVNKIQRVRNDAHARFDAISRTYFYKITAAKDVFEYDKSYFFNRGLDISLMNSACQIMMNYKDFECFSRTKTDVKTFICNIESAKWEQTKNYLGFTITADRFLRNMVRAIVGTMLNVGTNKISLDNFQEIIQSKDRSKAGSSAPAKGLYLTEIKYPKSTYLDE